MTEVVCVVDASQVERHAHDPRSADIWRKQIRVADRLMVNRHRPDQDLVRVIADLRDLAKGESGMGIGKLSTQRSTARGSLAGINSSGREQRRHADRWESCSVGYDGPIDGEWLEELVRQYADVLIRAKGFLQRTGAADMEVFQLSGSEIRWHSILRRAGKGQLVCIGFKGPRFAELVRTLKERASAPT
ncbi:MAG: hypothetical protein CVU28_14415 [Betaproteobacteria bacterium HGW-Betaproteobacteria-21]|nr:MAG: hypothetical protein CVU28_14415 [Betaproteobacteria bacterium HGW-Betaproteobacteria-21]